MGRLGALVGPWWDWWGPGGAGRTMELTCYISSIVCLSSLGECNPREQKCDLMPGLGGGQRWGAVGRGAEGPTRGHLTSAAAVAASARRPVTLRPGGGVGPWGSERLSHSTVRYTMPDTLHRAEWRGAARRGEASTRRLLSILFPPPGNSFASFGDHLRPVYTASWEADAVRG